MLQGNIVKVISRRWRDEDFPVKSQSSEAFIHVGTGFLLFILCIRPFEKISDNENKVMSNEILKTLRLVSNYFYKVSMK